MKRRKWYLIVLVGFALGLVSGLVFGQAYPRNETLYITRVVGAGPTPDWNPFITWTNKYNTEIVGLIYEPLFFYDAIKDELIPWLVESGEWQDATHYVVKLREGLTWQDGEPLTAEDVVFTFELGKKYPEIWFSPLYESLEGVVALDEYNVEFSFGPKPPYHEFVTYLYEIPIVPKHIWEGRTEEQVLKGTNVPPIGSGAYLYKTHSFDRNVYVRNEDWWGTKLLGLKPAPKYIVDLLFKSNETALGAMLKEDADLSGDFLPGLPTLLKNGRVKGYFPEPPYLLPSRTVFMFLNTSKPPLDDPNFRKALAYAINVDAIIDRVYGGIVSKANPTGLLPHLEKYVDQEVVEQLGVAYDPAKAKELLTQAGYVDVDGDGFVEAPDGTKIALEVTCPYGWTDWMEAIRVIAESAQAVGINLQHGTLDYGAWRSNLGAGRFDTALYFGVRTCPTPWRLYSYLFDHPIRSVMSGNFSRYDNPEVFALVDKLSTTPLEDTERIKAICSQIQRIMLTDMPVIPLWYNGLWSEYNESVWTNWPTAEPDTPHWLPCVWAGYWQLGGLHMLTELKPAQ